MAWSPVELRSAVVVLGLSGELGADVVAGCWRHQRKEP